MSENRPPERDRPSPEELLRRYQLADPASSTAGPGGRGRLRIYVGMAAGVGKTYAMLNEGNRREARGTDVVIGYVEAHKRPLTTQQIGTLEIIPRKKITYRGVTLEEMDVDAVLARHPQVALVDELAHTNVPGSRNEKRYQDVEELLDAGITVISTVNIQHLEGLNDLVETITGVKQRETLPDRVLDEADEVELIDISPDALRSRLRHGNVYPPDRAQKALENYFSESNLTALRELALRRIAEKTESQLEALMESDTASGVQRTQAATEHVMVAFNARSSASQLIRDAWRLARGLKAELIAVTVVPPGAQASGSGERRQGLGKALDERIRLAEDLGAEVVLLQDRDVVRALSRVARERHITQIVVGQPERNRWSELLRGSVVDRLLREPLGADIHVVARREHAPHT